MIRRTDEEILSEAERTMSNYEAVGYSSLARRIGTTPKRLKRLIESSTKLRLISGEDLHKELAWSDRTESTWVDGFANAKGVYRHRVQAFHYITYVTKSRW
jgi:hypothetical protein